MKRIHSKEEIIQIGLELILSNGFNATGVEAILKQAKIPKGSFYNFFSSKEEFCLKIIDKYIEDVSAGLYAFFADNSHPPLLRIRKSFESRIALFESYNCTKGCLLGNLGQEMSDQYESVRQRLLQGILGWEKQIASLLRQAQEDKELPAEIDVNILAENMIASFQGSLLLAKVKKSPDPLHHFIGLYFSTFLQAK